MNRSQDDLDHEEAIVEDVSGYFPKSIRSNSSSGSLNREGSRSFDRSMDRSKNALALPEPQGASVLTESTFHGVRVDQPVYQVHQVPEPARNGFLSLFGRGKNSAASSMSHLSPDDQKQGRSGMHFNLFGRRSDSSSSQESKVFPSLTSGISSLAKKHSGTNNQTQPSVDEGFDVLSPPGVACMGYGRAVKVRIDSSSSTIKLAGASPHLDKKGLFVRFRFRRLPLLTIVFHSRDSKTSSPTDPSPHPSCCCSSDHRKNLCANRTFFQRLRDPKAHFRHGLCGESRGFRCFSQRVPLQELSWPDSGECLGYCQQGEGSERYFGRQDCGAANETDLSLRWRRVSSGQ